MNEASKRRALSLEGETVQIDAASASKTFGSADDDFINGIASQLINVVTKENSPSELETNFAVAILSGVKPQDELETMLALQMVAIHNATITFARRLAHVENGSVSV